MSDECDRVQGRLAQRSQFGDGPTVAGNGQGLTGLDAVQDLATLVSQLAHSDFCHGHECITRETDYPIATGAPSGTQQPAAVRALEAGGGERGRVRGVAHRDAVDALDLEGAEAAVRQQLA